MKIKMTNRDSGIETFVTLQAALYEIGGGTSKYNAEIKEGLENGKKYRTDDFVFQKVEE